MKPQVHFVDRETSAEALGLFAQDDGAWVIGVRAKTGPVAAARHRFPKLKNLLAPLRIKGGTAGKCAVSRLPNPMNCGWFGAVGLGHPHALTRNVAETIGRQVATATCQPGLDWVFVDADFFPATAAAFAMGWVLRATPHYHAQSSATDRCDYADGEHTPKHLVVMTSNAELAQEFWDTLYLPRTEGTLLARDLMQRPANDLTPVALQTEAEAMRALGATVTALNATELKRQKLNLLHAVGKGSACPPRLIIIDWPGQADQDPDAPVVFVGKGITFDTGGISIKPADGMEDMKGDMGGAATVLGAMKAIAMRRAPQRVIGLLAVAENAVSGSATRPGDIVRACNGTSVEIVDTDAEGRLVLADALAYARATYDPSLMVDVATLTGAVVRALGRHHAGLFTPQDTTAMRLQQAADVSGEPLWRLPLPSPDDDALKSEVADLKNCAWGTVPDAMHAAGFLSHFASETPWAHLDIAGTAEADADTPLTRKGPVGFGVRLLDALICAKDA